MPVEMEAFYVAAKLSSTFCRPTSTKKSQKSQKSQLFLRESRRLYIIIILIPYVIIDIYSVKRFSLFFACDICDFVTATNRCHIHGTPTALH